jgi:hypothetical protein
MSSAKRRAGDRGGRAVAQPSLGAEKPNVPGLAAPDEETAKRAHPAKPIYSPYAGRSYPTRPFFGDTHLHTGSRWMPARSAPG